LFVYRNVAWLLPLFQHLALERTYSLKVKGVYIFWLEATSIFRYLILVIYRTNQSRFRILEFLWTMSLCTSSYIITEIRTPPSFQWLMQDVLSAKRSDSFLWKILTHITWRGAANMSTERATTGNLGWSWCYYFKWRYIYPHSLSNHRRSFIDLCIVSCNLALSSSITLDDSDYSDYLPVKVQLIALLSRDLDFVIKSIWSKRLTDWTTLLLSNTALLSSCNSLGQPMKAYEDLVQEIKHSI